jgi:outer membrane lipoprotein-sorting protein
MSGCRPADDLAHQFPPRGGLKKDEPMKRTLIITILCMTVAVTALAWQKPASAMPTVDQILDKYVQALGGKAALEKITSTTSKGTFEIPTFGASGSAEMWEKAPNKAALKLDIPGFGVVQEGFNGTVAWSQDPQSGLREKTGAELEATKIDADFYKPLKLKQLYPKITVKGKDKIGDKDAYVLEATPAQGSTETWYFDATSGLLARLDIERESPQGKISVQVFQEDYKDVDGIKVPHTVRQVSSAFTLNIKLDEVKHNVALDDAKFNKPAAQ